MAEPIIFGEIDVSLGSSDIVDVETEVDEMAVDMDIGVQPIGGGGIPPGGSENDVLIKHSSADYDTAWSPIRDITTDLGADLEYDTDTSKLYLLNADGERISDGIIISGGGGGGE